MPPTPKNENIKKMEIYENENLQKHINLVNLGLREYQNRIQHVHKSAHAKYELCSCQERRVMTSLRQNRYLRIQGRMQFFRSISCFWMFDLQPFLDLKNSKCSTRVCNLLNLSDLQKVAKILFKNTKYYKKYENLHATLDSQVPMFLRFLPPEGVPGSS